MKTFLVGVAASLALVAATVLLLGSIHISTVEDTSTAAVHVIGEAH